MNTRRRKTADDSKAGPPVPEELPDTAKARKREGGPAAEDLDPRDEADGGHDDPLLGRRLF